MAAHLHGRLHKPGSKETSRASQSDFDRHPLFDTPCAPTSFYTRKHRVSLSRYRNLPVGRSRAAEAAEPSPDDDGEDPASEQHPDDEEADSAAHWDEDTDELLTALEVKEADAQRCLREPTNRRPFPKTPLVGLMRLKDYLAEEKAAAKVQRAKDRQQREAEKRSRDAAALARRAGPAKSGSDLPRGYAKKRMQGKKLATTTASPRARPSKTLHAGSVITAIRAQRRRSKDDANCRGRPKRSVRRPERFRDAQE